MLYECPLLKYERAEERGGAPRMLTDLHVVPARVGRLLRFRGDMLHAVPRPAECGLRIHYM